MIINYTRGISLSSAGRLPGDWNTFAAVLASSRPILVVGIWLGYMVRWDPG